MADKKPAIPKLPEKPNKDTGKVLAVTIPADLSERLERAMHRTNQKNKADIVTMALERLLDAHEEEYGITRDATTPKIVRRAAKESVAVA